MHCSRPVRLRIKPALPKLLALAAAFLVLSSPVAAEAHPRAAVVKSLPGRHVNADCYAANVPVSTPAIGRAQVYGQLCIPRAGKGVRRTVQLLVPGTTYNHNYFDWPQDSARYSYVTQALAAGYSTFNVDRLGTGRSTLPPAALVTLASETETLHQVISSLRSGRIGHHAFARVVWVGHSLGSALGWFEAQRYHDVDAFVLTGIRHTAEQVSSAAPADDPAPPVFPRAMDDPKFAGKITDPGYLTTAPGVRGFAFYYAPNAGQSVIDEDEILKDVTTEAELAVSSTLSLPAAQAPSRAITVPTLVAVGDHDASLCTPECSQAALQASEQPYYSRKAHVHVAVVAGSGHDIQLHKNARQTDTEILAWIRSVAGPGVR